MIKGLLMACLATLAWQAGAEESGSVFGASDEYGRFSVGLALGNFDTDTEDSNDPHLNELAYTVLLGVDFNRYLALDAEFSHIESGQGYDDFNVKTAFGARYLGASLRIQWPLADDFRVYLRGGAALFELDNDTVLRGEALDGESTQPLLGGGIRGNHWFVEYVNYGEIDDLHIEQIRAGLLLRF